jgi:integrase
MSWTNSSSLRAYYTSVFRPAALKRLSRKRVEQYDSALRRFEKFVGGGPRLGSVTHELLADFTKSLRSRRTSPKLSTNLAGCICKIVREWDGTAAPRVEVLPPAEPGTLRHYFEETYKPEVMFACDPESANNTLRAIRRLRQHMGRDVLLSELSDGIAADFLQSLRKKGMSTTSTNNYRAVLIAVWNHAFMNCVVDRAPRIKKLKQVYNPPEAWSINELRALAAAAQRFRPGECYGQTPCDRWWSALLMIAYETALRRRSLMAIRRDDIDLSRCLLVVDGSNTKTLKGQVFRLSVETIEAIKAISDPPRELLFSDVKEGILYKHFGLLIDAAGIRRHRRTNLTKFHAMRRSTATLVAAAAGIGAAATLLGHADKSYVTLRYCDPRAVQLDVTTILPKLAVG